MVIVEYQASNCVGYWTIAREGWEALECAGWFVEWSEDHSTAISAEKRCSSLSEGIEEWEKITGLDSDDLGCPDCGPVHHFTGQRETEITTASYAEKIRNSYSDNDSFGQEADL